MKPIIYGRLDLPPRTYYLGFGILSAVIAVGLGSAWYMEHNGHWVTGMDNQVVWGMPHVFAIFLIVAASGALNLASLGSVFGRMAYKPLGRLSGLMAIALLVGGLSVLVLDLGRPDRLIVAMIHYNFKSIFAWNIFLYTGFIAIVGVYLWTMMERRVNNYAKPVAILSFLWRLALTTGTGLIFGFLVAREAFDAAVMAPLFVTMSFAFGLAVFILALGYVSNVTGREVGGFLCRRMGWLLAIFIAAVQYMVVVQHLGGLYAAEHSGVERYILFGGGVISALFWFCQILVGAILPLALLLTKPALLTLQRIRLASVFVILGGFAQVYVIIIGGQSYPLVLFPGMDVSSSFSDGGIAAYTPRAVEVGLGLGGCAIAALITYMGARVMDFLPASLSDVSIDPHHQGN